MTITYPMVLKAQKDGGFLVTFPDMPAIVAGGDSWEEAYAKAHDALLEGLTDLEDEREFLPVPTPGKDVIKREGDMVMLLSVDTFAYRRSKEVRPVSRNVTMPAWMAGLAQIQGLSYTKVLQDALLAILRAPLPVPAALETRRRALGNPLRALQSISLRSLLGGAATSRDVLADSGEQ